MEKFLSAFKTKVIPRYYKTLNTSPEILHCYYINEAALLHNGTSVIGQKNIQKHFEDNYRNCHTNICDVNVQMTIDDNILVQVVGKLSKDGQPMRRFFQSFILVSTKSNKYKIHNDILRYDDMQQDIETLNVKEKKHKNITPPEEVIINYVEVNVKINGEQSKQEQIANDNDNNYAAVNQDINIDDDNNSNETTQHVGRKLFVSRIPRNITKKDLKRMFSMFGSVSAVYLIKQPNVKYWGNNPLQCAYITYENSEYAYNCLTQLPLYVLHETSYPIKLNVSPTKRRNQPHKQEQSDQSEL